MQNWLQNLIPLIVRATDDTSGCSAHIPEIHFQNAAAMMRRACQAKCGGRVGILKQLGTTMNYTANIYERK